MSVVPSPNPAPAAARIEFIAFHLMPYAHAEIEGPILQGSPPGAWVTLSNEHYDPPKGVRLYRRFIDELVYAAEVGFDGVSVNEHHQNAYGTMPNPNLLAASLIERIPTGRIGVLGNALPLHDPIQVAEQVAMLDVLSGGRVISGFVRGIGCEYTSFGLNPNESRARFHEAHDLIMRAWTERGPFAWDGQFYSRDYVNIWPRPVQQPHPPVWIPSQGSSETVEWAAERRYTYLQTFTHLTRVAQITEEFRQAARSFGYQARPQQIGWAVPIYVGESDARARAEYAPHVEFFFNRLLSGPTSLFFPPGYLTDASHARVLASRSDIIGRTDFTLRELEDAGLVIVGGPESVTARLREAIDATGVGVILPVVQAGTLPHDLTMESIRRFGELVIPALRDHVSPLHHREADRVR